MKRKEWSNMKNRKKPTGLLAAALATLLCLALLSGCALSPKGDTENKTDKKQETAEKTKQEEEPAKADLKAEDPADAEPAANDPAADDPIYEQFLHDELTVDGQRYSEIFSFMTEDFGEQPVNFYYDVDEDGKDELLVSTIFYGYNIYDVLDGNLYMLDCGDGTAAVCGVYKGNGHVYVGHSDFTHAGRQYLTLTRYDQKGEIVETIEINADYWEDEDDLYDENSEYTYNGEKITMQEYEDYMNSYEFIDPDSKDARPAL